VTGCDRAHARLSASSRSPLSVSVTPFACRMNKVMPRLALRARICCESGGCRIPRHSAARVMCPVPATITK
jgi:hypothetical protein